MPGADPGPLVTVMMVWWRMLRVALRLVWPYLLTPWRSPLLRWRLETYGIRDAQGTLLSASAIGPQAFWRFVCSHHRALLRFLCWAAQIDHP